LVGGYDFCGRGRMNKGLHHPHPIAPEAISVDEMETWSSGSPGIPRKAVGNRLEGTD
jgi:hypothetical protein